MKTILIFIGVIFCCLPSRGAHKKFGAEKLSTDLKGFSFIENKGQWDSRGLFTSLTKQGACQVLPNGLSFACRAESPQALNISGEDSFADRGGIVWNMEFAGMSPNCTVKAGEKIPGYFNYFIGNDPQKWGIGCDQFSEIYYQNIWKGIGARIYGNADRSVEYDFILEPGADVTQIRLLCNGPLQLEVNEDGELDMQTPIGMMKKSRPVAYQIIDGKKRFVDARFILHENEISFSVGKYDKNYALIIDPIVWSTWVCGSSDNCYVYDVAADDLLNAYITGYCSSASWPVTPGNYSTFMGSVDIFVAKINNTGTDLIFSSIFGGTSTDIGYGLKIYNGDIYVAASTYSNTMPMPAGAYQAINKGSAEVYLLKLDASGKQILGATYLGGSSNDQPAALYVNNGELFVCGSTNSGDFPVSSGALRTTKSTFDQDGFIVRLNPSLKLLLAGTYLGGNSTDNANSITGESDTLYVVGVSASDDFPIVAGAFQSARKGPNDIFALKINKALSQLSYSTYIGSNVSDNVAAAIVRNGILYFTGATSGTDYPINATAPRKVPQGSDIVVTALSRTGGSLVFSTYVGATNSESARDICFKNDLVLITGTTSSSDFKVTDTTSNYPKSGTSIDVVIVGLDTLGKNQVYSYRQGGTYNDYVSSIVAGPCGVILSLTSHSPDFRTSASAFIRAKPNGISDAPIVLSLNILSQGASGPLTTEVKDTFICQLPFKLTLKSKNAINYWFNGSPLDTVTVNSTGRYWVRSQHGCQGVTTDSFIVIFDSMDIFTLRADTILCKAPVRMDLVANADTVRWNTTEDTKKITIFSPGIYWAETYDKCGHSYRDSFILTADTGSIRFHLPNDTFFCNRAPVLTLSTGIMATEWSTGEKGAQILVKDPAKYIAVSHNKCNEFYRDSFSYSLDTASIFFRLPADTLFCDRTPMLLLTTMVDSTNWSTGQKGPVLLVTQPGMFSAVSRNKCGEKCRDSILVMQDYKPFIDLPFSREICGNISIQLETPYEYTVWSTGDTGKNLLITDTGTYRATAVNGCGFATDTIRLTLSEIGNILYIPTAFTPDGNSLNEVFPGSGIGRFPEFSLEVINRWGQIVYMGNSTWDGYFEGKPAMEGVYAWRIEYVDCHLAKRFKTGNLTLLR